MEIYETYNDDLYNTADDIKSTYILPSTEYVCLRLYVVSYEPKYILIVDYSFRFMN